MAKAPPSWLQENGDVIVNTILVLCVGGILLWKALENYQAKNKKKAKRSTDDRDNGYDEPDDCRNEVRQEAVVESDSEPESEHEIGEILEKPVEDLHFGLPRCKVMGSKDLLPMPTMIKWPKEKFEEVEVDIARVRIGSFKPWVVQGVRSNRILYAMKKCQILNARCSIVPTPPPKAVEDDGEVIPDTYGPDLGKIQLIP